MKKLLFLFPVILCMSLTMNTWKIELTVSEPDAEIFQNGNKLGYSPQIVKIGNGDCAEIEVRKTGFITEKRKWCIGLDKKGFPEPKKKEFIQMQKDEAYEASASTNVANVDVDLSSNKEEDKAWKIINEVVTTYFDVLETTDKTSGYIKTAWVVKTYNNVTIRTRVIVKGATSDKGIRYKIKIVSEVAEKTGASAKDDELFKAWDRILKKYNNMIPELQSRL